MDLFGCTVVDPEKVLSAHCVSKHISWDHLKADLDVKLSRPLPRIWVHAVFYFKFNGIVYNKFPIDIWENFCDFVDGKREKSFYFNWLLSRLQRYTNMNHSCPYTAIIVKANNVSIDEIFPFDQSVFPSGQYRIDVTLTDEYRVPFANASIHGSNAEHYLEKV